MAWLVALEKDDVFMRQLVEALQAIDPNLEIIRFTEVRDFILWLGQLEKKEPEILSKLPAAPLRGVITEIEGWGFKDITLIQKIKPLLVKLGYAVSEDEICIVLTGHDNPKLDITRYEHRFVNNFIFKPFDKLLLRQTIETAFTGRQPVKKYHINNFKTEAQIEMLKEIRLREITEIGFGSIADQDVQTDKVAKYYADFLETQQHRSAFARAVYTNKIENSNYYNLDLSFFALDQQQSFNLQKMIKAQNSTRELPTRGKKEAEFLFVEHERSTLAQQLRPSFERFYNGTVSAFSSISDLNEYLKGWSERSVKAQLFIFIDLAFWVGNELGEVKAFRELHQDFPHHLFLLSSRIMDESTEREMVQLCDDIFYAPFNRSYIIKSLKFRWPYLENKESIYIAYGGFDKSVHVSNLTQLMEVSEAGLVLLYPRELAIGTFREFVFWMSNELNTPEIVGQCNYVEFDKEKKMYACHFVFFGMKDYHLKHIRLWVLHNYIEAKKEGAS